MHILVIAPHYPFFDRSAGDLRLLHMLKALTPKNRIWFCSLFERAHAAKIGEAANNRYRQVLEDMGINVALQGPRDVLREVAIDAVFFEFYFAAQHWIDSVRALRPEARIVIDSVDVHFHRLASKARLTGETTDALRAADVKVEELAAYRRADVVVVVSEDDGKLIAAEAPEIALVVIPVIYVMHAPVTAITDTVLTFVGGFAHEPNADAVLFFCREVLPLIEAEVPNVVFNVIGNAPPPEVEALASESVRILGYVPDTTPYLQETMISVAPLRYGAGMKGKVGEAMSHGLPVVTTSVGIEGFGLTPGMDVLVGDSPQAFAQAVVRMVRDPVLREGIRLGGWNLIRARYSDEIVQSQVVALFDGLKTLSSHRYPPWQRAVKRLRMAFEERVLWRFGRP